MSDSVQPHRWQPTRLPHPWDSLGKNTGVGCHFLLQCMKVKIESEVTQSCPTLSDPMDHSPPGSSVHGILLARVLEWGAIAFSNKYATCCLLSGSKQKNKQKKSKSKNKQNQKHLDNVTVGIFKGDESWEDYFYRSVLDDEDGNSHDDANQHLLYVGLYGLFIFKATLEGRY